MNTLANNSQHILVVDDDSVVRFIHTKMLTTAGYQVTQAEDGEQAVAFTQAQFFDAILMDIQMPKMDGLEATVKIRANENNSQHTRIIGITGFADTMREDCLAKGMNEVLAKPVEASKLLDALICK